MEDSFFTVQMFLLCVCGVSQWVVTEELGWREENDNTVVREDRPLVVSAKEDPVFPVCSLCQAENY